MIEMVVAVGLFTMITLAGYLLFIAGQSAWMATDAKVHMQENMRLASQRISAELQESGTNSDGVLQVFITDGGGVNGSDILRFSVPICICYTSPINEAGDVQYWGAPLNWGQAGCTDDYPTGQNGKVDICHHPPGNPDNPQNLSVNVNAVKAHLAHGDSIGDCGTCDFENFTNRYVEYSLNANGQMVRRVLDANLSVMAETVVAESFSNFQATVNGANTVVTLSFMLTRQAGQARQLTTSGSLDVYLRNEN